MISPHFLHGNGVDGLDKLDSTFTVERSTGLPNLYILFSACFSSIVRIDGNSSTTSLKSSACSKKISQIEFATTLAVRLALVKRQISRGKKRGTVKIS